MHSSVVVALKGHVADVFELQLFISRLPNLPAPLPVAFVLSLTLQLLLVLFICDHARDKLFLLYQVVVCLLDVILLITGFAIDIVLAIVIAVVILLAPTSVVAIAFILPIISGVVASGLLPSFDLISSLLGSLHLLQLLHLLPELLNIGLVLLFFLSFVGDTRVIEIRRASSVWLSLLTTR